MKKLILIFAVVLCSCDSETPINGQKEFRIITVDGCEYLAKYNGYQQGWMFTHKGNCKNHTCN